MKYHETEIRVRFNEVDHWGIVWHGHYISYFEMGRINLARKFALTPADFAQVGYTAPVIELKCQYKEPARNDEELIIHTTLERPSKAALTFKYQILRKRDKKLLVEGETTQVLLDKKGELIFVIPEEIKKRIDRLLIYLEK
ncbi:acyl-CoA thioesterase [bacterium]|nr:acyl-CoA thioesterase [bacterium]MCG2677017.1 acyl-CoA thioesterase [bacterium]